MAGARAAEGNGALRGWLRLARCRGLGVREAWKIARAVEDVSLLAAPDETALLRSGLRLETLARLRTRRLDQQIDAEIRRASASGWTLLHPEDDRYPPRVAALAVPPPVLTVRGDPGTLLKPAVAIVGSRHATGYGIAHAGRLAGPLAAAGLPIVSGLARGIDAAAHRAALDHGGETVAVLGTGADVVYPPEHHSLARRIESRGALVTEFPPGAPPLARHFPRRNRLIAGLALAVVVVEAEERSGSLVTARWAADEGRQLLAAPGRAGEPTSLGTLALVRDGAALACTADDVLEELPPDVRAGLRGGSAAEDEPVRAAAALERLGEDARRVFDSLPPHDDLHVDSLLDESGMAHERVLTGLFELELAGLAEQLPGGRFRRCTRRSRAAPDPPPGPAGPQRPI